MHETTNRLLPRVVPAGVGPLVVRVLSVLDDLSLEGLHEAILLTLGWREPRFYSFRIHGQEVVRRRGPRSLRRRLLREFRLRPRERFLGSSGVLDLWEWEIRVLCRSRISGARLRALPFAARCRRCQEQRDIAAHAMATWRPHRRWRSVESGAAGRLTRGGVT